MADTVTGNTGAVPGCGPGPRTLGVGLWRAVSALATTWAGTPMIQCLAADLPRNAAQRVSGVPGRLQEMEAGGAGISGHPLRLVLAVHQMNAMPSGPVSQGPPGPQEWAQWLTAAATAETAHRFMIAWLRSRMPGYPDLPAPHLAPGTPLRADEMGWELLWTQDQPRPGLQLQNPPSRIGQLLRAGPKEQQDIANRTQVLGTMLEDTAEWQSMSAAADALTGTSRAELRRARTTLSQRLSPAGTLSHSQQAHGRSGYRAAVLEEVLAVLSGPTGDYARSFGAANRLIDTAASDVFSQLVAYGLPATEDRARDIDLRRGPHGPLVSFTRSDDENGMRSYLEMGQLTWLDGLLVRDCVQVTSSEISFGLVGERQRYTANVLSGTGEAWSR
jgi:hypothetical protein